MYNENNGMRDILTEITGTHWIGVKFHKTKPRGIKLSRPEHFCAAASHAITETGLLKVRSIPCGGAKYAFNVPGAKAPALADFIPARLNKFINPEAQVTGAPRLSFSPEYVSFNLPGGADIYLSFMLNESANELAQAWSAMTGKKLDLQLTGVMSFCSEGAASALNGKKPSFSLGCARSIKAADLQGQVCVCLSEGNAARFVKAWRQAPAGAVV